MITSLSRRCITTCGDTLALSVLPPVCPAWFLQSSGNILGANDRVLPPVQTRLVGLAKKHRAAVLCLTEKDREHPSVGSLVSIRAEAARTREEEDRFLCEARVVKDKRRGPGWRHREICHGPAGLR